MFQMLLLAAPLLMGASLLGVSYSDGTLIAARSAAQVIGWLLVFFSTLAALCMRASQRRGDRELRHLTFAEVTACATAFFCGVSMLYVSYFEWSELPSGPIRSAAAQAPAYSEPDYKIIHGLPPVATLAGARFVSQPVARREVSLLKSEPDRSLIGVPTKNVVAQVSLLRAKEGSCSAFAGVEFLQCNRCANESGLSLLVCHERARLEHCQDRQGAEPSCPSAIPYSPPQ
jgi:hypothetical protein